MQDLPVLVYGRGDDEEPIQEETNVRRLNFRGGLITLARRVAPGFLMNPASEEDQRCRVAFVGEQHFGRNMIGIQFTALLGHSGELRPASRVRRGRSRRAHSSDALRIF
jgi:hypothetical protein